MSIANTAIASSETIATATITIVTPRSPFRDDLCCPRPMRLMVFACFTTMGGKRRMSGRGALLVHGFVLSHNPFSAFSLLGHGEQFLVRARFGLNRSL